MLSRPNRRSALSLMRLLHLGLVLVIALVSAVPALAGPLPRPLPLAAPTTPSTASMTWLARTPSPVSVAAFGYVTLDGAIYLIGGDMAGTSTTSVQRYSPATDTWEVDTAHGGSLAPLPSPRAVLFAGVIDGKIHALGGWEHGAYRGDHFIYDPATNLWSTGPALPWYPIGQFAATVNDKLYVFGGWWGSYENSVLEYTEGAGWTTKAPMPTARNHGTTAVVNGKIYVIGGQNESQTPLDVVELYDPATDTWTTGLAPLPSPNHWFGSSGCPVAEGMIYVLGPIATAYRYDPRANTWLTLDSMPENAYGLASVAGSIYAIGQHATFQGIRAAWPAFHHDPERTGRSPFAGPQTNSVAWTFTTGGAVYSSPAVDGAGTIYVGSEDAKLYAVNPDGTEAWSYTTGGAVNSSPAIAPDESIYVGSDDGKLHALKSDGTFRWTYQTGAAIGSSPAIGLDGTIYVGSTDGQLHAVYPDGTPRCTYSGGWGTPSIGPDRTVYVATADRRFVALTPDCILKCQTPQVGNGIGSTPALSTDGSSFYAGATDGFFRAYNTSDCSEKWQSPFTYGGVTASAATGSDGTVYVGTEYGYLWALDPTDGSIRWDEYTTLAARSSPALAADGVVYFPTAYGSIFARNPDGTEKWTYTDDGGNVGHFFSSPAISADGMLYVGSTNGKLYAFGPSPQLHLVKSASRETAQPGDTVSYTLALTATISTAHAVLTDTLPSGMTYVPGSVSGGATFANGQVLYQGPVSPGPGVTIAYQAIVDADIPPGSVLYNSAVVTGTGHLLQRGVPVAIPNNAFSGTLVLIYANGDNNLSNQMLRLVNNAEKEAANTAVKILLLLDGPGDDDSYLYYLRPDQNLGCPNYINPTCSGRYAWDQTIFRWGEDIATPYSLAEFVTGALAAYPLADQVVLSLVGHGGGWSPEVLAGQPSTYDEQPGGDPLGGMLWDDHPGHALSTPMLGDALDWAHQATGREVDLLYLDACLMSMTEIAYEVRDDAAYVLASENVSWTAFPYDQHIADIQAGMSSATLGQAWLGNEAAALREDGYPFTISLANLHLMDALRSSADGLASALLGTLPAGKPSVQTAFSNMVSGGCFDSNVDGAIDSQDNYCDLAAFARQIELQFAGNSLVVAAAQGVEAAVRSSVIAEDHQSGTPWPHPTQTWTWGDLGGLSVYVPLGVDNWKRQYYTGRHLEFAAESTWDEFLAAFWDSAAPPASPTCPPDCALPPGPPATPANNVQVSNVQDASFTVSWQTAGPARGALRYGTDPAALNHSAVDLRGATTFDDVHYVVINQLTPSTIYYFDILSDGQVDDNGGAHYTVTTGPILPVPLPDQVYGQVLAPDGVTPAENVFVTITLQDGDNAGSLGDAALMSDIVETTDSGFWDTNLGNARTSDLQSAFQYSAQGDRLRLVAIDGSGCAAEQVVDTANDTPAPALTLMCATQVTHQLATGWNLLGLNLISDPIPLAEEALDDIEAQNGNGTEVDEWLNGGWNAHVHNLPFNNYSLELGKGYFVKSIVDSSWQRAGLPPSNPLPVPLSPGWNLIGLPKLPTTLTAEQLLDGIENQGGNCSEADRWQYGGWTGHIHNLPFNNFTLRTDEGYFVKCSLASTYIPGQVHGPEDAWPAATEMAVIEPAAEARVEEVQITNLRDSAFSVVWRTDGASNGWVEYGSTPGMGQVAYDDRGEKTVSAVHHATVSDLTPESVTYLRIRSSLEAPDQKNEPLQVKMPPSDSPGMPATLYGRVEAVEGTPATGAVVIGRIAPRGGDEALGSWSAVVDAWGYWVLSLPGDACGSASIELVAIDPTGEEDKLAPVSCAAQSTPAWRLSAEQ